MTTEDNVFIPHWPEGRETQGSYWQRLGEEVVSICDLEEPPEAAIKALAFIVIELPTDIDPYSVRQPLRRIRQYLSTQSDELRNLFRTEAMRLASYREAQINNLLKVS